jgi:threonine dehydratase
VSAPAVRTVAAPTPAELDAAVAAVAAHLQPTPLVAAPALGERAWLKLESLQPTGSFKVRGAIAALSALTPDAEVVTASAGNHALGIAWAATTLGRRAIVVVPENASPAKLAALADFDARVVRHGSSYDEAERHALAIAEQGAVYVSPYNDARVIAGQSTIGRELDWQLPGRLSVVTPVGGGGLSSGLGLWAAGRDGARVVGVESDRSPAFRVAIDAGEITAFEPEATIADGLGGNIEPGSITFSLIREHLAELLTVSEPEIEDAVRFAATRAGVVAEGSAAVGIAAVRAGRVAVPEGNLVVLITGRNIAAARLAELLAA